jgi:hypothetical protein
MTLVLVFMEWTSTAACKYSEAQDHCERERLLTDVGLVPESVLRSAGDADRKLALATELHRWRLLNGSRTASRVLSGNRFIYVRLARVRRFHEFGINHGRNHTSSVSKMSIIRR